MPMVFGPSVTIEDLAFCPTLKALYETKISIGRSGKIYPYPEGLSTLNNLIAIRRLFEAMKPEKTLEVGFALGGSALTFAACHQALGRPPGGQHVVIDPFQETLFDGAGFKNLELAKLDGYVRALIEPSQFALAGLSQKGEQFDLMYFDGSKQFDDLFCDFYFAKRLLTVGGIVMFDDCSMPSVRRLIRYIDKEQQTHFSRVPRLEFRHVGPLGELPFRIGEALAKVQMVAFRKACDFRKLGPS